MRNKILQLPRFKGKQRILSLLDKAFGPYQLDARYGVVIEGFASSSQDMAFLRRLPDNELLETLIRGLPRNGTFVDIGANCGFYSSYAARLLGPAGWVVSVEPSRREFRRLLWALDHNSHVCTWVHLNLAATSVEGVRWLDINVGHTGMNRVSDSIQCKHHSVACLTIDRLVECFLPQNRTIDLVKIDVEGHEYGVLQGMVNCLSQRRIRHLVIEVTDKFLREAGSSKQELYDFLKLHGYVAQIRSDAWQYDEHFVRPREHR